MANQLSLETLVDLQALHLKDQFFVGLPFEKLGKNLTSWLDKLLTELGVGDTPKIAGEVHPQAVLKGRIYIAPGAVVDPHVYIEGPTYIGPGAEVRHGAFIRGSAFIGAKAVVGHTTEVKGSIFFDDAKAGHFAYVGDSILGRNVNLGAGTKLANLRIAGDEVRVMCPTTKKPMGSGLRKLGSILGDNAQTGCNAVLSPGSVLFPGTAVLPCVHYRGTLTEGSVKANTF